jgi:ABC-type glutathione transport system ATPase component
MTSTRTARRSEEQLLRVSKLSVQFSDSANRLHQVLHNVSFTLNEGEGVAIVGESGVGKTTLALAIAGLLPVSSSQSGAIEFRGRGLTGLREAEWQGIRGGQIGIVFQEPALALNPVMRVGRQIEEVIRAHVRCNMQEMRARAEQVMRDVRLEDIGRFYDSYPHELSAGQRQRVVIAQAICCEPSLLIADEPTASLDTVTQAEILRLLRNLRRRSGMALLLITHDPTILTGLADRIIVIHEGRLVEEGLFPDVCLSPTDGYTRHLFASIPNLGGLS